MVNDDVGNGLPKTESDAGVDEGEVDGGSKTCVSFMMTLLCTNLEDLVK